MTPKISIIIPIYNSEKYLEDCINSLIHQSLKEIEIICIVNGSTDNSLAIIKGYTHRDKRLKLINLTTADIGWARNSGVRVASGEYLMFIDSDDWIKLDACEKLYSIAKEHDLELLQGGYAHVPNMLFKHLKYKTDLVNKKHSGLEFWTRNRNIAVTNWGKLWKRSFFIEKELYNSEGIYFEDVITSVKGFTFANSFMLTDYNFYYYRMVPSSIMHQKTTKKHIDSSFIKIEQLNRFINANNLENEPGIHTLYFKLLFIHYSLYDRKNLKYMKVRIHEINKDLLNFFPLKLKLTYYFPVLAAFVYPVWRKRAAVRLLFMKRSMIWKQ